MRKIVLAALLFLSGYGLFAQTKIVKKPAPKTPVSKERLVEIKTDLGTVVVKLYDSTPLHRDNFIKVTKEGLYNGTLFHRVIKEFMIQGGDPDSKNATPEASLGNGGLKYTVPAEFRDSL